MTDPDLFHGFQHADCPEGHPGAWHSVYAQREDSQLRVMTCLTCQRVWVRQTTPRRIT